MTATSLLTLITLFVVFSSTIFDTENASFSQSDEIARVCRPVSAFNDVEDGSRDYLVSNEIDGTGMTLSTRQTNHSHLLHIRNKTRPAEWIDTVSFILNFRVSCNFVL